METEDSSDDCNFFRSLNKEEYPSANVELAISGMSPEDLINFNNRLRDMGISPEGYHRRCDLCEKELILSSRDTEYKCRRCDFVSDICAECQKVLGGKMPLECLDGIGCRNEERVKWYQKVFGVRSAESPF